METISWAGHGSCPKRERGRSGPGATPSPPGWPGQLPKQTAPHPSSPLRLRQQGEPAAIWLCSQCSVPFVALCIEDRLPEGASSVRLDKRYFDISDLPTVSPRLRKQVADLAQQSADRSAEEKRRSKRVAQSLVAPAIQLDDSLIPTGFPFQLMVANLSREGIGLVQEGRIHASFVALELSPQSAEPIQVIVRLVRQDPLEGDTSYVEIGGEFHIRLGSTAAK